MLKKYKILVVGIAIILFIAPIIVMSGRLDDPRENRDCYRGNLPFYVCVIQGTNIMEKSFLGYPEMHEYYTPQLKETDYTIGNQAIVQSKKVTVGTMSLEGGVSYTYTKHV